MEKWKIGALIGFVIVCIRFLQLFLTTPHELFILDFNLFNWLSTLILFIIIGAIIGKLVEKDVKIKKTYLGILFGIFFSIFIIIAESINTQKILAGESTGIFLKLVEKVFFLGVHQDIIWNTFGVGGMYHAFVILFWMSIGAGVGYLIDKFWKQKNKKVR